MSLTLGAVQRIVSGRYVVKPQLQILSLSTLKNNTSRVCCDLTDGIQFCPSVISLVPDQPLKEKSIILLDNYSYDFSPLFGEYIIEVLRYKLFPDISDVEDQGPLPLVSTPVLLDFSSPNSPLEINNRSASSSVVPANQDSQSVPLVISRVSPLNSASETSSIVSISSKRPASTSTYSSNFIMASELYSKRVRRQSGTPLPIFNLSSQSIWTIRGRVTKKTALRDLTSGGHWFCFELSDNSGTIKVNVFKDESIRFFNLLKVGKVYTISNGDLIPSKRKFNTTGHLREITLKDISVIKEEINFKEEDFPAVASNFVKISALRDISLGTIVDTVGVCLFLTLVNQEGEAGPRRSILLLDDSATEIRVTIWNLSLEDFNPPVGSVLVLRGARLVRQFCGRILSVSASATVEINPDIPEVYSLLDWYNTNGDTVSSTSLSRGFFGDFSPISSLPSSLQADQIIYTNLEVSIVSGSGHIYKAHTDCGKKVKIYKRNVPVCEGCTDTLPELIDQLVITFQVSDSSGQAEVVAFTDVSLDLLSLTMSDIPDITDEDLSLFLERLTDKTFKFCIKTRESFYHGNTHLQHSIKYFSPVVISEI
ncbi:replication protein A 70 kDa DNA-binding subunit-like [Tetranychus urticae]|nr:replication protein A 70 kDa DNA-binding subunit-like [Tetranychus urticae]